VLLVRSVNGEKVAQVAQPQPAGDPVAQECLAQVRKSESGPGRAARVQGKRKDDDEDIWPPLRKGIQGWIAANGGVVKLSQRKLARQLGASRTTLQRALGDAVRAGAVVMDAGKFGTRLALAG